MSKAVVIALPHLRTGGAERQALELARDLSTQGIATRIVLLETRAISDLSQNTSMLREYQEVNVFGWGGDRIFPPGNLPATPKPSSSLARDKLRSLSNGFIGAGKKLWRRLPWEFLTRRLFVSWMLRFLVPRAMQGWRTEANAHEIFSLFLAFPGMLLSLIHLERYLCRHRTDLIIAFLPKPNLVALVAGKGQNIPVVISERNDVELNPPPARIRECQALVYPSAALITANTRATARALIQAFPSNKVGWIPNGTSYRESYKVLSSRGPHACIVSRLEPQKQIDEVIDAWNDWWIRDNGIQLHIFGSGSQYSFLKQLAAEREVDDLVKFHGSMDFLHIPFEDLGISIYINNSRFEGSSNALHEAIHRGLLPIVKSSVREFGEEFSPEVVSTLCIEKTKPLLSRTMRILSENEELQRKTLALLKNDFRRFTNLATERRLGVITSIRGLLE